VNDDLGPKPDPDVEEPELFPGGPDAVDTPERYHNGLDPAARDLDPDDNPAVDDATPDEISQPDDKKQEPNGDSGTESSDDGVTEPPA
jgi:hypothetical protein